MPKAKTIFVVYMKSYRPLENGKFVDGYDVDYIIGCFKLRANAEKTQKQWRKNACAKIEIAQMYLRK